LQQLLTSNEKLEQRTITTMIRCKCLIFIFSCFGIELSLCHPESFNVLKICSKTILVKAENNHIIDGERIYQKNLNKNKRYALIVQ